MFNLQPFPGKLNYNYKIIKDNWFVCLFLFLSQVVDLDLLQEMKATIRKRSKLKATSATDIEQQQMFKMKYPTWTKILTGFGDEEINCALAEFLVSIIEHTEGLFKLAPERQPEDYDETVDGATFSKLPNSKTAGPL